MKFSSITILLILSVAFSKVSFSDKCYRFENTKKEFEDTIRQYYFNKKGTPIAHDLIMVERDNTGGSKHNKFAHYYHSELSGCSKKDNAWTCTEKTVSVWFRIYDIAAAPDYKKCDTIFQEKFADVTKYGCQGYDPFQYDKAHIGTTYEVTIQMNGNVPAAKPDYVAVDKCEINNEILGRTSNTTWIIVVVVVVVIVLIAAIFFLKGKKGKRFSSAV